MEEIILLIIRLAGLYFMLGAVFSVAFLLRGIGKVDEAGSGASVWFKLLIFPGLCVFWFVFLVRWIKLHKS